MNSPWLIHGLMALLLVQLYLNFRRNELTVSVVSIVLTGALWSLVWAVICFGHNLFTADLDDWRYLNLWTYAKLLAEAVSVNAQLLMTLSPNAWTQMSVWPGPQAFPVADRIHFNLFLLFAYGLTIDITPLPARTQRRKSSQQAAPCPQPAPAPAPSPTAAGSHLLRCDTGHIDYRAYVDPAQVRNIAVRVVSPHAGGEREKLLQVAALFEYVKSRVNYISDPITMRQGVKELGDFLASPVDTLEIGGGDCDDQALLMASLLSAVGLENRILFVESPSNGAHLLTEFAVDASLAGEVSTILEGFYTQNTRVPGERSYLPFVVGDRVWLMADTTRDYVGDYRSLVQQDFLLQLPNGLIQWHAPPVAF